MGKAIQIKTKKASERHDPGGSKFFGDPTIPLSWQEDFDDDEIFFCQIRLSDIADLDKENRLPHTGYFYIFLHTEDGNYNLRADVRYYAGEPELVLDEFNAAVDGYEQYTQPFLMEFQEVDDGEICTRLFGIPSDWCYAEGPPKLLLQYDPLDNDMGFLDGLDGFLYFFFGEDEKDLNAITMHEEYS